MRAAHAMRSCDRARHQHGCAALMLEVAIGKAKPGDGAAEAAVVLLVDIEARLERQPLQRGADIVAADLQGVAGQPEMAHRAGAGELDGACGAHVIENTACAAGAVETGEGEPLAGHEFARLFSRHRARECRCNHGSSGDGPQYKTRKHAVTPTPKTYQRARR